MFSSLLLRSPATGRSSFSCSLLLSRACIICAFCLFFLFFVSFCCSSSFVLFRSSSLFAHLCFSSVNPHFPPSSRSLPSTKASAPPPDPDLDTLRAQLGVDKVLVVDDSVSLLVDCFASLKIQGKTVGHRRHGQMCRPCDSVSLFFPFLHCRISFSCFLPEHESICDGSVLKSLGIEVAEAQDGQDALRMVNADTADGGDDVKQNNTASKFAIVVRDFDSSFLMFMADTVSLCSPFFS